MPQPCRSEWEATILLFRCCIAEEEEEEEGEARISGFLCVSNSRNYLGAMRIAPSKRHLWNHR